MEKIEREMSIDFESKPFYGDDDDDDDDDKYIKTKIKIYNDNIMANFHKKAPNEKIPCKCLSIITLDSVTEAYENYYPQTFLEECKYLQEKLKLENYINNSLDSDSDDNDDDNDIINMMNNLLKVF